EPGRIAEPRDFRDLAVGGDLPARNPPHHREDLDVRVVAIARPVGRLHRGLQTSLSAACARLSLSSVSSSCTSRVFSRSTISGFALVRKSWLRSFLRAL